MFSTNKFAAEMNNRLADTLALGIWQRVAMVPEPVSPEGRVLVAYLAVKYENPDTRVLFNQTVAGLKDVSKQSLTRVLLGSEIDPQRVQQTSVLKCVAEPAASMSGPYGEQMQAVAVAQALMGDHAPCAVFGILRDAAGTCTYHFWYPRNSSVMLLFEYLKRAAKDAFN